MATHTSEQEGPERKLTLRLCMGGMLTLLFSQTYNDKSVCSTSASLLASTMDSKRRLPKALEIGCSNKCTASLLQTSELREQLKSHSLTVYEAVKPSTLPQLTSRKQN